MAYVDFKNRTIRFDIVYYGPPYSGKTTTFEGISRQTPEARRGEPRRMNLCAERALFWDFDPGLEIGPRGWSLRFSLSTLPGHSGYTYDEAHEALIKPADGYVFVGDSRRRRGDQNERFYRNLIRLFRKWKVPRLDTHRIYHTFPLFYQWNRQDDEDALPLETLCSRYRWHRMRPGETAFPSVALTGEGILEPLKRCMKAVMERHRDILGNRKPRTGLR